jgi:hypothetical protein
MTTDPDWASGLSQDKGDRTHERISPVLAHYRTAGLLISIDVARPPEDVAIELADRAEQWS